MPRSKPAPRSRRQSIRFRPAAFAARAVTDSVRSARSFSTSLLSIARSSTTTTRHTSPQMPTCLQGLSWNNIAWAWTATVEANWHPLTWISHMADVQFFGTNPRGHHVVSVVLHAFNVVLLFFVLRRATGCVMRSAVVAALFAVHPLNVECVAWVAERKSLLSMFFLLLALAAYGWYASKRSVGRYAVVVVLFALGLAAKPMIVTLPLLASCCGITGRCGVSLRIPTRKRPTFFRLVVEKIPLFALSAASSWITLYAQRSGGALGNTRTASARSAARQRDLLLRGLSRQRNLARWTRGVLSASGRIVGVLEGARRRACCSSRSPRWRGAIASATAICWLDGCGIWSR